MIHQETLKLLEWHRLCEHLATFATTKMGVTAAQNLVIPELLLESQELLSQTEEIYYLEQDPKIKLVFEGIVDIRDFVKIATLGGYLFGKDLLSIATTLDRVRRLKKIISGYEESQLLNLKKLVNFHKKNYADNWRKKKKQVDIMDICTKKKSNVKPIMVDKIKNKETDYE